MIFWIRRDIPMIYQYPRSGYCDNILGACSQNIANHRNVKVVAKKAFVISALYLPHSNTLDLADFAVFLPKFCRKIGKNGTKNA